MSLGLKRNIHPETNLPALIVRSAKHPAVADALGIRRTAVGEPPKFPSADIAGFSAVILAENIRRLRIDVRLPSFVKTHARQLVHGYADAVFFLEKEIIFPNRRGFLRLLFDCNGHSVLV